MKRRFTTCIHFVLFLLILFFIQNDQVLGYILDAHQLRKLKSPFHPQSISRRVALATDTSNKKSEANVVVMGGGSFGLAIASVLARNGVRTHVLVRDDQTVESINTQHQHFKYLTGCTLPQELRATSDPSILSQATHIVHAIPVQHSQSYLQSVAQYIPRDVPVLNLSKGIESTTLRLMDGILMDTLGGGRKYAFLSGPSFAKEIVKGVDTVVTIASHDRQAAREFQALLRGDNFQVLIGTDVIGLEIAGAVKNVIAIGAGICEGLKLGTNSIVALVTTGMLEMKRLGRLLGGKSSTFLELCGAGDTFGTCFGPLSRNRKFGIRLAQGESPADIIASGVEVCEGLPTSTALVKLIKKTDLSYRTDLKYPILTGIADIIHSVQTPREGLDSIMKGQLISYVYT